MSMLLVTKLLTALVLPLGIVLLSGLASLVVQARMRRLSAALSGAALLILWGSSAPVVSDAIRGRLEQEAAGGAPPARADAAVVLGGALEPPWPPRTDPDLGQAADRILYASRLYRQGTVPLVIVSGGSMPWYDEANAPEANLMEELLVEWGVERDAIVREPESRTTYENCRNVAAILEERGIDQVLLVTSALHMRRALATCRKAGIRARPAPTDFEAVGRPSAGLLDWLPDAEALLGTQRAVKELLGYEIYRWRGWIR